MSKLIKVYGWRNIHTDEWYIGQTRQALKYRALSDGGGYRRNTKFGIAIQEYGWDSFEENILRLCTSQEEADYWEQYFIKKYDSIENGYNIFVGGTSSGSLGYRFSEESKRKKSESLIGHKISEETRRKISERNKGRTASKETIQKLRNNNPRRRVISQFTLEGQFIAEWGSTREVERVLKIPHSNVVLVCQGKWHTAGGYIWRYAE